MTYHPQSKNEHRGAASAETAVVLLVIVTLSLGMFDLGMGVFRNNICSQAARQGARLAIVHGKLAPPQLLEWGPSTYTGTGSSGDAIPTAIRPYLAGLDPAQVTIQVEWLDATTEFEGRVRVTVSTPYQPFLTFVFGNNSYTVSGSSTMRIAH